MSWSDVDEHKPESSGWGKLKEGSNYIRIVSEPTGFYSHYNPSTKKSTICLGTKTMPCDICQMGSKRSSRFIINAFELVVGSDGKFTGQKILKHYEFPYSIINALEGYRLDPEYKYESTPSWDVNIKKETGSEPKDVKYQVIPARKDRALSKEELEQMEGFETPDEMIAKKREFEGGKPVEENPKPAGKAVTANDDEVPLPARPEGGDVPDPEGEEEINLNDIPF